MYFKIIDDASEAWRKLTDFVNRIEEMQAKNIEDLRAFSGVHFTRMKRASVPLFFCGPIVAILPESNMKGNKAWHLPKKLKADGLYIPSNNKHGRAIKKFIDEQPVINMHDHHELFNVTGPEGVAFNFAWTVRDNLILIRTPEYAEFTPLQGMIEITETDFNHLKNVN
jgi:hypothetical protein